MKPEPGTIPLGLRLRLEGLNRSIVEKLGRGSGADLLRGIVRGLVAEAFAAGWDQGHYDAEEAARSAVGWARPLLFEIPPLRPAAPRPPDAPPEVK